MKLLSAISVIALSLSAVASSAADTLKYKHAKIIPGVLPEDMIAKLANQVGTIRPLRGDGKNSHPNSRHSEATVPARSSSTCSTP